MSNRNFDYLSQDVLKTSNKTFDYLIQDILKTSNKNLWLFESRCTENVKLKPLTIWVKMFWKRQIKSFYYLSHIILKTSNKNLWRFELICTEDVNKKVHDYWESLAHSKITFFDYKKNFLKKFIAAEKAMLKIFKKKLQALGTYFNNKSAILNKNAVNGQYLPETWPTAVNRGDKYGRLYLFKQHGLHSLPFQINSNNKYMMVK